MDPSEPEDLKRLTESGFIWNSPYEAFGVKAILDGLVKRADCRDLPDQIRDFLVGKGR